jgi:hypothetical protein
VTETAIEVKHINFRPEVRDEVYVRPAPGKPPVHHYPRLANCVLRRQLLRGAHAGDL